MSVDSIEMFFRTGDDAHLVNPDFRNNLTC